MTTRASQHYDCKGKEMKVTACDAGIMNHEKFSMCYLHTILYEKLTAATIKIRMYMHMCTCKAVHTVG